MSASLGVVDLGGVEEREALFDRRPNQGNHLLLFARQAVTEARALDWFVGIKGRRA